NNYVRAFKQKDPVALGRLLKEVENQTDLGYEILKRDDLYQEQAHIIGITGPPGAGKSTLVNEICKLGSKKGLEIGVVGIDPTSPFTGGALLGDRVRMQEIASIPGVFIKSLATRGNLGGMASSTSDIVRLMDIYGKDIIIIETVGV